MGQRLVVSIKRNLGDEKSLCKLYYHWSGYTSSALDETLQIINHLESIEDIEKVSDKQIQLSLIRFCESNGGGIDGGEDFDFIEKYFPDETFKKQGYDRSYGLIAISDKVQESVQGWSEGDVEIGLNDRKVSFYVDFYIGQTEDEVKNEFNNIDLEKDVIILDKDIEECSWEDFADIYDKFNENENLYVFKNIDGSYFGFIE